MVTNSLATSNHFFDTSLAAEPSSLQYLLLEAGTDKLKICAYHLTKMTVVGFSILPFAKGRLDTLIRENQKMQGDFEQTIISFRSNNFTIVPKAQINVDLKSIFTLTNEFNETTQTLLSHSLVNLRANVIYAIDKELLNEFKSHFARPTIIPHIAPRIEHQLNQNNQIRGKRLILHISADFIELLIFDENQLLLANSFYVASKEDIAYYLLFCAESLQINPAEARLEISGNFNENDELAVLLKNYWQHIDTAPILTQTSISSSLPEFPKSELAYLTQSLLCAL